MQDNPELLSAYKNGEKNAFLYLYNKHASPLRKFLQGGFSFSSQGRICRYRGVDASMDVESIVQETFARAFVATTRKNYDGARPFQTYLFSIAKNLVLRECYQRDRMIHVDNIEEKCEKSGNVMFLGRDSRDDSPHAQLENRQLKELTNEFIAKLNREEKDFFSLRFAKGNTQEGTAELMGTTRARIKLLEKNMRKRFLDMLNKHGYLLDHRMKPRWQRKEALAA